MSELRQRVSDWMDQKLRPGGGGQYVVVGVLALIIVAAVVIAVVGLSGSPAGSSGSKEVRFKCVETGEEFTFERGKVPPEWEAGALPGPGGTVRLKNPKTGKHTVVIMTRCPNCQGYFVPPGGSGAPQSVCPHCKTNITQRRRDNGER